MALSLTNALDPGRSVVLDLTVAALIDSGMAAWRPASLTSRVTLPTTATTETSASLDTVTERSRTMLSRTAHIEVMIPEQVYRSTIEAYEFAYQGGSGIEVEIPSGVLPLVDQLPRIGHR